MITYPDISNYEAGLSIAGALACIAKATEGTGFTDHTYPGFRDQAHAMGIPFAAYHFLHHDNIPGQAAFALSVVGATTPLMLDVEVVQGDTDPTLADTLAFIDAYRAAGGRITLAYIPHWFWRDHWGSPSLQGLPDRGVALISSNYTDLATGAGWQPYGGVTPAIWQYTSTQPFNGQNVDFNAYQGTVDQLRALFNGTPEEDMALRDDPDGAQLIYRVEAIEQMRETTIGGPVLNEPVPLVTFLKQLAAEVAALAAKVDSLSPTAPAAPVDLVVTLTGTAKPAA